MIYVQVDANENVLGYSSNRMSETDIEIEEEKLEERFFNVPFFYKFNNSTNKFEYREDLFNEYKEKKNNIKKPEDVLLKQIADIRVDSMKKDTVINNLMKQIADIKINTIKRKGDVTNG